MIAPLKLSESVDTGRGLERRVFPRKEMHVQADIVRLDHILPALRRPSLKLDMRDVSYGGLSAISDTPLAAGERVSVFVAPRGLASRGWDAYGHVIRCAPSGTGYRVAIEFDHLPAA
jgi:hypothetical protein